MSWLDTQLPAVQDHILLDLPAEHVLRVTLNRPRKFNAMTGSLEDDLCRVFDWAESEAAASIWVILVTGKGKAFCAGQDLADWQERAQRGEVRQNIRERIHGFGSMSRRYFSKPTIGAINGLCFGGGLEAAVNLDVLVAASSAQFGYPEVLRGVVAAQGGIPRLARICGQRLASELLLTGRAISAQEAHDRFGLVNFVVPDAELEERSLALATAITSASPDAVQATKLALEDAWRSGCGGVDKSTVRTAENPKTEAVYTSANFSEGLRAFSERRAPRWVNPSAKL